MSESRPCFGFCAHCVAAMAPFEDVARLLALRPEAEISELLDACEDALEELARSPATADTSQHFLGSTLPQAIQKVLNRAVPAEHAGRTLLFLRTSLVFMADRGLDCDDCASLIHSATISMGGRMPPSALPPGQSQGTAPRFFREHGTPKAIPKRTSGSPGYAWPDEVRDTKVPLLDKLHPFGPLGHWWSPFSHLPAPA